MRTIPTKLAYGIATIVTFATIWRLYTLDSVPWNALCISSLAGLSTTLGALIVIFRKTALEDKHLAGTSGMAAAVMLTVSFWEMLLPAYLVLSLIEVLFYFALGFVFFYLLNILYARFGRFIVHTHTKPSSPSTSLSISEVEAARVFKVAVITAVSLTIHNLPEG